MNTTANYGVKRGAAANLASMDSQCTGSDSITGALMPEPDACGLCESSITQLAILLTKANEQDRAASRSIENAADRAATQEEDDRVAQLRAKASADQGEALANGIGGIVGGACAGAAGFTGNGQLQRLLDGGSKAAPDLGKMIAGQYTADGVRADAEAARFDAQAQANIRRYSEAQNDEQAASESIRKVEEFLDQVQQTENATRLAAATYRG